MRKTIKGFYPRQKNRRPQPVRHKARSIESSFLGPRTDFYSQLQKFMQRSESGLKTFLQDFYQCNNGSHVLCQLQQPLTVTFTLNREDHYWPPERVAQAQRPKETTDKKVER